MASFKKILRSIKSSLSDSDSASETSSACASHTSSGRSSRSSSDSEQRRRSRSVTYKQYMSAFPEPPPKPPRGAIQPELFTSHLDDLLKLRPSTSATIQKQESIDLGRDKSNTHYKRLIRKLGRDKSTLKQKIEDLTDQLSVYSRNHERMTAAFIRANSKLRDEQKTNQILSAQNELMEKRLESAMTRLAHLERRDALRSQRASASLSSGSSTDAEEHFSFSFEDEDSSLSETSSFVRQDFKRRPRRPVITSTPATVVFV